ncbi:alpha/beta-hydrolase [Epithele typhae]|uniref:alpha/beta-hydrolase n=1 Tax=Epithele typhae TaxID=378194 RepID=UPI0020083BD4|nr:alpha/beta-hydrolase [Epithele typhae]KAH9945411.1 alpha/beta-hydrolase [Epithele typhae]
MLLRQFTAASPSVRTAFRRNATATWQQLRPKSSAVTPVELHFDKVVAPDGNEKGKPLVIIHGLFGTKRNWGSLSKAFAKDLGRPVYALDMRNHGTSPHAEPHSYLAMAADVLHFLDRHKLTNISLMGHSMGGKVAMAVALDPSLPSDLLSNLVVVDIAPSVGSLSPEFQGYIQAMQEIEDHDVMSRKEAASLLEPYEQDPMTCAFLLMNLEHAGPHHPKPLKFKIPIGLLGRSIPELGGFPYTPGERTFEKPTLFIKGSRSKYINRHNVGLAEELFPNMTMKELPTGHWVHSEKPNEFKAMVTEFLKDN